MEAVTENAALRRWSQQQSCRESIKDGNVTRDWMRIANEIIWITLKKLKKKDVYVFARFSWDLNSI